MLYIGEEVGPGQGPEVDIALDPLEGTAICAKNLPNSLAAIAITRRDGLLNAPDVYMEKIGTSREIRLHRRSARPALGASDRH